MDRLEPYYRISTVAGISMHLGNDGNAGIDLCTVSANRNELDFTKKATGLTKIEQILEHVAVKTTVSLNLSGKGVLEKRVDKMELIDQDSFGKILPNAKLDDFYVQNFISGEYSFVSIIRKTDADRCITRLKEMGLTPLSLSLGPFPLTHILSQLNIYDKDIIVNGHLITRGENGIWLDHQFNETAVASFPYKISSETIDERLIVPYAAAFQLVMVDRLDPIRAEVVELDHELETKITTNRLKVQGIILLLLLFILLLINFVIFSTLARSNAQLSLQAGRFVQDTSNSANIRAGIKNKEMLLDSLGWEKDIKKSVLIDQLMALMPEDILMKEVSIEPIDAGRNHSQRNLEFVGRTIRLTGTTEKIIPVNEWMARIKTRSWVKIVQMDSYTYNNELKTAQFILTVNY
ncbi:hypothetical protein ACPPVU_12650 [Mucilaginibacter sp. McL0603]|uniref:hypothetical protein n=1 Tax=Mucilaginibacter sp. McL0603 TaxID=3415670 RepID=UPI003CEA4913